MGNCEGTYMSHIYKHKQLELAVFHFSMHTSIMWQPVDGNDFISCYTSTMNSRDCSTLLVSIFYKTKLLSSGFIASLYQYKSVCSGCNPWFNIRSLI